MIKIVSLVTAAAALLSACATARPSAMGPLAVVNSPVSFDGDIAGKPTDLVFVLVPDANPRTPGVVLGAGESLRLVLPREFQRNAQVPLAPDSDTNAVLTKGWPQGSVRQAQQYRIGLDDRAHALTFTALQDISANGANAPGIKAIHVRGRTFINPGAGSYPVTLTRTDAQGRQLASWQGEVKLLATSTGPHLAPTNFHLAPGSQGDFQSVPISQQAPRLLGLLLWGTDGAPLNGVGVTPRDLTRFPRYTGGLLVQDSNGDGRLDPAVDTVVGGIIGAAPQGATGQVATSPTGADGKPMLSGQALRNDAYPNGGKPNAGLLPIQFRSGSLPGLYQPVVELTGGNSYRFTIEATTP